MEEVKNAVLESLQGITGRTDITPEMNFISDLPLTSVNAMKLLFDLENELGIDSIPQEILYTVETVQDLIDEVEKLK